MSAEQECDEEYIPPTNEERTFKYGEKDSPLKLKQLIEKQKRGMELGITPKRPIGLHTSGGGHWRHEIWNPWLKKQGVTEKDLRSPHIKDEGQRHSNPN